MTRRISNLRRSSMASMPFLVLWVLVSLSGGAAADYEVRGRFLYRDREFGLSGFTGNEPDLPIRLADVQVVDANTQDILATSATDNEGFFTLLVADDVVRDVIVRVLSSSFQTPDLFLTVRTQGGSAIYAVAHPIFLAHDPTTSIDFVSSPIVAIPYSGGDAFNIFDVALDALNLVAEFAGSRPTASQSLTLYWSSGNTNGTYYSKANRSIYLLGFSFDSDAYDDSVILHELAHYVEFVLADSDNFGGSHSLNGCYDLRLAWSEGWATFFQNMVRNWKGLNRPEIYVDTTGRPGPGGAFLSYGVEEPPFGIPGSGNEIAVNAALWDIVDDGNTGDATPGIDDDLLQIAAGPERCWDVLVHYIPTASHISVEDFWDGWFVRGNDFHHEMVENFASHGMEFAEDAFEPDDSQNEALPLCSPGTTHHTIFGANDQDWMKIAVSSGSEYSFRTSNVPCGSTTQLVLYSSTGTALAVGTGTNESSLTWTAPFEGDAYLRCTRAPDLHHYASYDLVVTGPLVDPSPPHIEASVNRTVLWPPNHRLTDIEVSVLLQDACDPEPSFVLASIVSDEADEADGSINDDIKGADYGTADTQFQLRSERDGDDGERTYTITYVAMDDHGNMDSIDLHVRVPHDQSGHALAAAGFSADGTSFLPGASSFCLVIPAESPQWEPAGNSKVDPRLAFVGNHLKRIPALSSRLLDATGDGVDDLMLEYPVAATLDLAARSVRDDVPVGFRYVEGSGTGFFVADIFALGSPLALPGRPGPREELAGKGLAVPLRTALVDIIPNPFNPLTTVRFDLAKTGPARLQVFDPRGLLVRTLRDGDLPAGRHEATWDGTNRQGRALPTGVYFIRLVTLEGTQSRKAILMK